MSEQESEKFKGRVLSVGLSLFLGFLVCALLLSGMLADLLCMMVYTDVPGVVFVLPDSYIDPVNKEYGGRAFLLVIKICLFCSVVKLYLGFCFTCLS